MLDRGASWFPGYRSTLEDAQALAGIGTLWSEGNGKAYRVAGLFTRVFERDEIPFAEIAHEIKRVTHKDDAAESERLTQTLLRFESFTGELRFRIQNQWRWLRARAAAGIDGESSWAELVVAADVTDEREERDRLHELAFRDPGTGWPNRTALLQSAHESRGYSGLVLVRFEWVGATSTRSLESRRENAKAITKILRGLAPDNVTMYRYNDDVAAITIPRGSEDVITSLVAQVAAIFEKPIAVGSDTLVTSTRIAVVSSPAESITVMDLLRRGETALREAERVPSHVVVYSQELEITQRQRGNIERHLRYAVAERELRAVYQPIISIETGKVVAAEALMRWHCPEIGFLNPDQFIPLAEDSGVILELGRWMLCEACEQLQTWQREGFSSLRMAINISVRQARSPDTVATIREALEKYGIEPRALEVELTERAMLQPEGPGARNLQALRDLGVRVSVDDFGTGYSALSYLAELPADVLKLDRTFIVPLERQELQRDIAASVIRLAHKRGLSVIGEGVETREQLQVLGTLGCDEAQGYYIAAPMPADEFAAFLRS